MVEIKNNYYFAGILLVVALIAGGVTYQLVPTGSYKVCDNGVGWQFNSDTGQYSCGDRKYDCSSIRSTKTGKSNYFCDEATRVEVKEIIKVVETEAQFSCPKVRVIKYDYDGSKWICNDEGQDCAKWSDLMDTNFR